MLLGRTGESGGRTVVTVRLWDEQVAAAYRTSFDEFTREHPDIEVRVNVVAYTSYFDTLRTDVAGGGADDVFWLSNAYFAGYADNGRLLDIGADARTGAARAWEPSVVDQFTRNGKLWGVPQLTDAGIAVYFNADLLDEAGRRPGPAGGVALVARRRRTRFGHCWHDSPSTPTETAPTHRDSTPLASGSWVTTPPTTCRAST